MIVVEMINENDRELKRTYSDDNKFIRKVGTNEFYEEAIDVLDSTYEYVETSEEIIRENIGE